MTDQKNSLQISEPGDDGFHTEVSLIKEILERIASALETILASHERIAGHLAPEPSEIIDTTYIAKRLDCTTVWVAEMVRDGAIPKSCIVVGTGNGKPWKFYRRNIESWLATR